MTFSKAENRRTEEVTADVSYGPSFIQLGQLRKNRLYSPRVPQKAYYLKSKAQPQTYTCIPLFNGPLTIWCQRLSASLPYQQTAQLVILSSSIQGHTFRVPLSCTGINHHLTNLIRESTLHFCLPAYRDGSRQAFCGSAASGCVMDMEEAMAVFKGSARGKGEEGLLL
jgi:hypothetical protein